MLVKNQDEDLLKREVLYNIKRQLQEYAVIGLRTLVLAGKEIDPLQWNKWKQEYNRAQEILDDEELRNSLMS
jgi:phospholipid-transporting ATPase